MRAEEHLATAVSHHLLARVYPGLLRFGITLTEHADRRRATNVADRALYGAKEGGRNQVVFAEV